MKRTKGERKPDRETPRISDAIHTSVQDKFTKIPNVMLRNPDISAKAKTVLSICLSNKDGWKSSIKGLSNFMREGETAITNAIGELQQSRYLKRIRYRRQDTKKVVGSFWAVTDQPGCFDLQDTIAELDAHDLEMMPCDVPETAYTSKESHTHGNHTYGNHTYGNHRLKRLNNKKKNNKKTISMGERNSSKNGKLSINERNKKFLPYAKHLACTVQKEKGIKLGLDQIESWCNDIRLLVEKNQVSSKRIKRVLKWYRSNIGGDYIPQVESGSSLRDKFTRLEDAIKRQKNPPTNSNGAASAYRNKDKKYETEGTI